MRLENRIAKILSSKKKTLSIAESCTGGLLSHTFTNISGSSTFFLLGIIAYDNAAKTKLLNVPSRLIRSHGAVSAETAALMAKGVRRILNTDYSIAVTGIAGPGGGNQHKPVGTTYIALCHEKNTDIQHFHFKGGRTQHKNLAKNAALRMLLKVLA